MIGARKTSRNYSLLDPKIGGVFRAPITNLLTTLAGFAFVDDTDLLQTQHHHTETLDDIVDDLEGSLDTWQGTLSTSGGALDCDDPNKSYWYEIEYEWNTNGRWKYSAFDINAKLMMYDDSSGRKEVPHCHTDEAHKTLGVMLAPDENNRSQIVKMRQISRKFGYHVRVGFIRGPDVLQALNSTVMRSLNWTLPAL